MPPASNPRRPGGYVQATRATGRQPMACTTRRVLVAAGELGKPGAHLVRSPPRPVAHPLG